MSYAGASPKRSNVTAKLSDILFGNTGAQSLPATRKSPRSARSINRSAHKYNSSNNYSNTETEVDYDEFSSIEHRGSVIEMVAHDIRSPLMSAQVSLDLIEELYPVISDRGFQLIESVYDKLSCILLKAKEMLNCSMSSVRELELDNPRPERSLLDIANQNQTIHDTQRSKAPGLNADEGLTRAKSILTEDIRSELMSAANLLSTFETLENRDMPALCRKHLERAQNGIFRGIRLIEDQLSTEGLSKNSVSLKKEACSATTIAADATKLLKNLAELKKIKLINKCTHETIIVDKSKIAQVLINYLSNAIKFSPERKTIVVKSEILGKTVRFAVIDQGPGMDEQTKAVVFKKFAQAQTVLSSQGHGLGLSICKLIAEAHGGSVGVESNPGCGSTFWLILPLA